MLGEEPWTSTSGFVHINNPNQKLNLHPILGLRPRTPRQSSLYARSAALLRMRSCVFMWTIPDVDVHGSSPSITTWIFMRQ